MHYSIYATVGSIFFLLILFIINLSKEKRNTVKHKMFSISLYITLAMLISEIVFADLYVYTNLTKLADFFLRIHWLTSFFWMDSLFLFVICFIEKNNDSNIKNILNNKFVKICLIILTILKIIFIFIPFSEMDPNNLDFIPGLAA